MFYRPIRPVANLLISIWALTFLGLHGSIFEVTSAQPSNNLVIVKYSLAFVWGFAFLGVIPGRADDVLPPRFNFDRYTRMIDHSPFAVATAVAMPAATPDFAKDLYVANAAHSSEGDLATIMSSSDQNFKKYLTTKEPMDGYSIASIEWSEKVGETKVTISKDGKFATLTFNQALLSQAASPGQPDAGQMPQSVPLIPPPQAGAGQASRAHSRGVILRNPKTAAAPAPNPAPMSTPNVEALPIVSPSQQLSQQKLEQQLLQQQNDEQTRQIFKRKADFRRP